MRKELLIILSILFISSSIACAEPVNLDLIINCPNQLQDGESFVVTVDNKDISSITAAFECDKNKKKKNHQIQYGLSTLIEPQDNHKIEIQYIKYNHLIDNYKFMVYGHKDKKIKVTYKFDGNSVQEDK